MPYSYVINSLEAGMAAKRPNMVGYVKKTIPTDAADGEYELTFVKRDGTETVYEVAADGTVTCTSPMSFDVELAAGMMADDWISGTVDSFESARSGGSNIW